MENGETDVRSFVLLKCAQIASVALGTRTEKRKMGPSKDEGWPGHPELTNIVFAEWVWSGCASRYTYFGTFFSLCLGDWWKTEFLLLERIYFCLNTRTTCSQRQYWRYSLPVSEYTISRNRWAVPSQSSFESQAGVGASPESLLHHRCLVSLSAKFLRLLLALPPLHICRCSSAGEKQSLGPVFPLKILFYVHWPFSKECFTPSALKCQHFPWNCLLQSAFCSVMYEAAT